MKTSLTLRDTEVLKGVALLMLLCHHCLESGKPYQDVYIHGKGLVLALSVFCKLCVSIFVFLSGYGLTLSANRQGGIGSVSRFYRRRYVKLMMNYWLIWLLFVPFGVFVMGRTFPDVYGEHVVGKALLDFFGLYYAVTGDCFGYNATWWFYGCIILLYAAFPLLYRCRKYWYVWVVVAQMPVFSRCNNYILAFSLGMIMAEYGFTPPIPFQEDVLAVWLVVLYLWPCVYIGSILRNLSCGNRLSSF